MHARSLRPLPRRARARDDCRFSRRRDMADDRHSAHGKQGDGEKRRVSLKVVSDGPKTLLERAELGDGAPSERSPWAWVLLGAFANFAVLVPLAMLTMALLKGIYSRSTDRPVWLVVLAIVCLCISSVAGGWLVGRFGGRARALQGM